MEGQDSVPEGFLAGRKQRVGKGNGSEGLLSASRGARRGQALEESLPKAVSHT